MSKLQDALVGALEELADALGRLENVSGVSAPDAHISYSCAEYPNARVYLDVVGNVVLIELVGNGWVAS